MTPYRIQRHRKRAHGDNHMVLVPFIDMLMIMVVFLLVHNSDVEILSNTKDITMPLSISDKKPRETVVVMITGKELLVDGRVIATVEDVSRSSDIIIAALKLELQAQAQKTVLSADQQAIADREVTILGDKSVPYVILKKVMATCTDADYGKVSLAVLSGNSAPQRDPYHPPHSAHLPMFIAPFYRQYELPWSPTEDVERRFRVTLRNALIVFAIFAVIIPFLKANPPKATKEALPDRVVQLVIEKRLPPPPPPPPKEEEKPKLEEEKPKVEPKPDPKPKPEPPKPDARKKAEKEAAVFDAFADMRDSAVIDKAQQMKNLTGAVNEQTRSERNLLTSKVGQGSGGINNAALSRGYGGGAGSLTGRDTTQVTSGLGSTEGRGDVRRTSGSGKSARSREEVELTFDQNKGAIYAIYTRALRENPDLKGKVVLEITIAPSGEVINCVIVSSELNNPELERRLVSRVKSFRFQARDVESLTLTKPIDFFPSG